MVNEEAHKKGLGKIDLYWFVYILNDSIMLNFILLIIMM